MKNRLYLYLIVTFLLLPIVTYSQIFDNLKIEGNDQYACDLSFRNIFGTFNKTLLFPIREYTKPSGGIELPRRTGKYYVLDADSNKIYIINFQDTTYIPLAFINNDTIVLKDQRQNDWLFFSESQNKHIKDIPKNLKALLEQIPSGIDTDDYFCRFEKSLNKMILYSTHYNPFFEIYYYNYEKDIVEKKECNIDKICKDCATIDAHWLNSNQLIVTLVRNMNEPYIYCIYNTINHQLVKMNFFNDSYLLSDCFDNYCLMQFGNSRPYSAAIYKIDTNSMKLTPIYQIYAEKGALNHMYRLGFVSPTKIARMSSTEPDFTSFEPMYNQIGNLFEIRFEKVGQ